MADEQEGRLTPLGREEMLQEHQQRIDGLDRRLTDVEQKEERRDKRWDLIVRSLLAIGSGIIIAIVSALVAGGHL